jgi:hypothetical protein
MRTADSKLKEPSNIRLCDHAVGPVFTSVHEEDGQTRSTTHERWEDHCIDVDDVDACTTENPRTCILGLSIDVFACCGAPDRPRRNGHSPRAPTCAGIHHSTDRTASLRRAHLQL